VVWLFLIFPRCPPSLARSDDPFLDIHSACAARIKAYRSSSQAAAKQQLLQMQMQRERQQQDGESRAVMQLAASRGSSRAVETFDPAIEGGA
jgi:hypothetical protein